MVSNLQALGGMGADQLRAYVTRITRLQRQADLIGNDISAIYKEVARSREAGFDIKAFRQTVRLVRDERDDRDPVDIYIEELMKNTNLR